MADKKTLTNTFTVVGHLKEVEYRNPDKQAEQVSARATIESEINGQTKEYEVEFFSKAVTSQGTPNKLYAAYIDLGKNIGKKIKVSGEFRENRYYSATRETVVGVNTLSGRFINYDIKDADAATFEFQGFVIKELSEKQNKEGEIYQYNIGIAQEGYKENTLTVINFNVSTDPESSDIVNSIRDQYSLGASVTITGELDFHTEVTTSEINNEGGFGKPIVREYTNTYRNYYITGGSAPFLPDDEKAFYNDEQIAALVAAYKAHDVELTKEASEKTDSSNKTTTTTSAVKPATKKTASLI